MLYVRPLQVDMGKCTPASEPLVVRRYGSNCFTYYNEVTNTQVLYMPGIGTNTSRGFEGYLMDAVLAIEIKVGVPVFLFTGAWQGVALRKSCPPTPVEISVLRFPRFLSFSIACQNPCKYMTLHTW